jgi:outer membrane usher protein
MLAMVLAASASAEPREDWYLATVNHRDSGLSILLLTDEHGRRWLRKIDLLLLDLPVPMGDVLRHAGEAYVPLHAVSQSIAIDELGERLHIHGTGRDTPETGEQLIADVIVNHQAMPEPYLLEWRDGVLWLPPELLEAARVVPPAASVDPAGWVPITALAGMNYVVDEVQMRVELSAPPQLFAMQHIDGRNESMARQVPADPARGRPAAILGYDIAWGHSSFGGASASTLLDASITTGNMTCGSRHLWRLRERPTRLDSNCIFDWPERRFSLVVGDAVSRPAALNGSVRYGGVRIGTDFALQPYLLTQPLLGLDGTARLPSVLEVWVEQQLALRTNLAPGQFQIDGLPALSGGGDITVVVTDLLGRRTTIASRFYSDPMLLRPDLVDWAIEFGRLREDIGSVRDRYTDDFGLATLRRGMTSWWTFGARAESGPDHHLVGLTNHVRLGHAGIAELSMTRNQSGGNNGRGWAVGYGYRGRRWGVGFRQAHRDSGFADLAYPEPGSAPLKERQFQGNARLGPVVIHVGGVERETATAGKQALLRAGLNLPLAGGQLSLSAARSTRTTSTYGWTATWTLPLEWGSVSAWATGDTDTVAPGLAIQHNAPLGPGYGYRAAWQGMDYGPGRASGDLRWRTTALEGGVTAHSDGHAYGLNSHLGGAVVLSGDGLHMASSRQGSYATVKLPASGVRIYRENQMVATTDAGGRAIVAQLRPFESNQLRVDTEDLPLDTQVRQPALNLAPGRRQVVTADFQVTQLQTLVLRMTFEDGTPVPAGSVARLLPGEETVPVGHDGLLYVEFADHPRSIAVQWAGSTLCTLQEPDLPGKQGLGDVHHVVCRENAP